MNDSELDRLARDALLAETRRLRSLIKNLEWAGQWSQGQECLFCHAPARMVIFPGEGGVHRDDCAMFTPNGELR